MDRGPSSFDKRGAYFVPAWLEYLFWVAFCMHLLISSAFGGWFSQDHGTAVSVVRFLSLSLTYAVIGCAFHAACNVPRPTILYADAGETVRSVLKQSFIHGLMIWFFVAAAVVCARIFGLEGLDDLP